MAWAPHRIPRASPLAAVGPLAAAGPLGPDFCDPRLVLPAKRHVRGIVQCVLFGLRSFNTNFVFNNILFLRLTYVIVCINNLFFLMSRVVLYYKKKRWFDFLFSFWWRFGSFQVSGYYEWSCCEQFCMSLCGQMFILLGQLPRSAISASVDWCLFNFIRNCPTVL